MLQLDPPLPMETSKGPGLAHFVIDYGPETHLMWVVFLDSGGACWTVPNPEVRMTGNWSMGRRTVHAAAACLRCASTTAANGSSQDSQAMPA